MTSHFFCTKKVIQLIDHIQIIEGVNFENPSFVSHLFLQNDYIRAIEPSADAIGMQVYTLCFFDEEKECIGVALAQVKPFRALESLKFEEVDTWRGRGKKALASLIEYQTLIMGNLMLTGENSWRFADKIPTHKQETLLLEGVAAMEKYLLEQKNTRIQAVFIKDFFESQSFLKENGYNEFEVEPNMVMPIAAHWATFDDYMIDLSTKYRTRVKRAFKKSEGIEKKILTQYDLKDLESEMHELYLQVCAASDFNLFVLPSDYFLNLQQNLDYRCQIMGYFLKGKLVGFYTLLDNGDALDANFLGYEKSLNHDKQLYLNMLLDMVRMAIEKQVGHLVFARTASEIKSSIGAEAKQMFLYLKHKNSIVNRILPYTLPFLRPKDPFTPRNPFK